MKKMMGLVGSILGLFVFSVLFFLFVNGMLIPKPPFVRAAKGYSAPDSLSTTTMQEVPTPTDDREGLLDDSLESPEANGVEVASASGRPNEDTAPNASPLGMSTQQVDDAAVDAAAAPANRSVRPGGKEAEPADATSPFDPEKMSRLVRVYEKMRPKQVGLILDTMPDAQSVAVLASMKDRAAAQVMAAMEPSKAARMSQLLVERNKQ